MIICHPVRFNEKTSGMNIHHSFHETPFGKCLIACTKYKDKEKVICHMTFVDNNEIQLLEQLRTKFPGAKFIEETEETKDLMNAIFFKNNLENEIHIPVLLKGTNFQLNVWESIISIPMGTLQTYQQVAEAIDNPKASRAVGSALKANQIMYLIPCHRVICKNGCNKFSSCAQRKVKMQEYEENFVNKKLELVSHEKNFIDKDHNPKQNLHEKNFKRKFKAGTNEKNVVTKITECDLDEDFVSTKCKRIKTEECYSILSI